MVGRGHKKPRRIRAGWGLVGWCLVAAIAAPATPATWSAAESNATVTTVSPSAVCRKRLGKRTGWFFWTCTGNDGGGFLRFAGGDHPAFFVGIPAGTQRLKRVLDWVGVACDFDEGGGGCVHVCLAFGCSAFCHILLHAQGLFSVFHHRICPTSKMSPPSCCPPITAPATSCAVHAPKPLT